MHLLAFLWYLSGQRRLYSEAICINLFLKDVTKAEYISNTPVTMEKGIVLYTRSLYCQ